MYLYILQGIKTGKYYIGITDNSDRRLREHNTNSNHYTGKIDKWEFVYLKYYEKSSDARIEELRLKKAKNKKYIEWYIQNMGQ